MWFAIGLAESLLLTLLIEGVIALIFRVKKYGWAIFACANIITNPIVVTASTFLGIAFPKVSFILIQLPFEIAATAVEALIFSYFSDEDKFIIPRPKTFAITANVISWGTGVIATLIRNL